MEPILIATKADHTDLCAISSFTLDMVIGHDRQDFTACFEPIENVGGGSLLYIDGTEYGGVVDDVTTDTESGIAEYHGRTWDGILAAKRIMPPSGSAYRTVSGEANSVLASLITLLDIGDVFAASTDASGITVSYQFNRFTDAYSGIYGMLESAGAKLKMHREGGKTVMRAVSAATISDEADSDLIDFALTKTNRTVNHLVCAGTGEGTERVILHLYADASGNVSQTQTLFGVDEITDFYDYNNADATELLEEGTKKLAEYQTKGAVEITNIGSGEWDIGDSLVARDNKNGIVVTAPVVGKTVTLNASTNWQLSVAYEVGEVSRTAATVSGAAEQPEKVNRSGDTMTGALVVNATVNYPVKVNCGSTAETMYRAERTDTNVWAGFGVGSGGQNHGVWSGPLNKWLIDCAADTGNVYVNGYQVPSPPSFKSDVLYNNESGTTGTVLLSASAGNYTHIRIHTKTNDGNWQSYTAYKPDGKNVTLSVLNANSTDVWAKTVMVTVSGTSIAPISTKYAECRVNGSNAREGNDNTYITRVEAWND